MARLGKWPFASVAGLVWAALIIVYACLASVQGYWRHDSWVYTQSELHEAIDGKFLAAPLHLLLHRVHPEMAMVAALCSLSVYLWCEFRRLAGMRMLPQALAVTLALSVFSSGFVSQLHWPIHSFAATLPLLASLVLVRKRGPVIRIARCLIVTLGAFLILSSFAFFGPLCLIPEPEPTARQAPLGRAADAPRSAAAILIVGLGWPLVLGVSHAITSLLKGAANRLGANLGPARLESVVSLDGSMDISPFLFRFRDFALRQWGGFAIPLLIALVVAAVLVIGCLCDCKSSDRAGGVDSFRSSVILAMSWILVTPVWASVTADTAWQRVALAWCSVPPLLVLLSYRPAPQMLRRALAASALAAAASSVLIGLYNFSQAAIITRRTVERVAWQIGPYLSPDTLYILPLGDISTLTPRYIWGGWPPFAAANPRNPRLFRLFDELGVKHYLVISKGGVFHPGKLAGYRLRGGKSGDGRSGSGADLLRVYNAASGARLRKVAVLDLSSRGDRRSRLEDGGAVAPMPAPHAQELAPTRRAL